MPIKQNIIYWTNRELKEILERKENIKIEKLILSHYGARAIIKT